MDESEIPIDIHTNKLLDWLISRRHVARDWSSNIIKVREKINSAIKDMPVHEGIATLLSGSYINYYHCQSIVEILKETESSSKNLFGMYGSQRMKDWVEILKLYEKDNLYLGEVASLLLRNVNYEIPALRKQIARSIHLCQEYDKKEVDYEKQANAFRNEFNASCKSLGIKGTDIKAELIDKAREFPEMNTRVAKETQRLTAAVKFYKEAVASLTPDSKRKVLATVMHILEKGDTTVYELNRGVAPSSVERIELQAVAAGEGAAEDDAIDFGADIDFGGGEEGEAEDIDWGISTGDTEPSPVTTESATAQDDSTARGDEARTVLGHPATRERFANDLLELEAFLKLRRHETTTQGDGLAVAMLPDCLQREDGGSLGRMLGEVAALLAMVADPTAVHCLRINTNPRYVDQLTNQLQQKLNSRDKMVAAKESVRCQRQDSVQEAAMIEPKVELLIARSRDLQDLIERDISRRYNGRPVNLMGGVNVL